MKKARIRYLNEMTVARMIIKVKEEEEEEEKQR